MGPWLLGARGPTRIREEAGSAEPGTGGARGQAAVGAPRERTRHHARPPASAAAARLRRARREYARLRGSHAGWGWGTIFRWGVGALPPHASPTATISLRSSPDGPLLQNTIGVSLGAGSAEITPLPSSPPLPPGCASGALLGGVLEPPLAVRFVCRALCLRYLLETSSSPFEVDVFTLTLRTRKARLGKTKNLAPIKDNWNPIRLLQSLDICTHTGLRMGRPPKALAAAAAGSVMGPRLRLSPSSLQWVWLPNVCVSGDSWEQLVSPNQAQGGAGREQRRQQWVACFSFFLGNSRESGPLAVGFLNGKVAAPRLAGWKRGRGVGKWAHRFQNHSFPPAFQTGRRGLCPKKLHRESTWGPNSESAVSVLGKSFLVSTDLAFL